MLDSCMKDKSDIFNQLRRMRHVHKELPSSIDGNEKPEERFKEVYSNLYNSTNDADETGRIKNEIESCIKIDALSDVDRITAVFISEIIKEIKPRTIHCSRSIQTASNMLLQYCVNI